MRRGFWAVSSCEAAPISKQALIGVSALAGLAIATLLPALPAQAQAYGPNYPVCLQTYGIDGNAIECGYTSLALCNQTASGRAAQCITNPYFAGTRALAGPRYRRHGRG
jgi:Protein of unknown function (DUF3551)